MSLAGKAQELLGLVVTEAEAEEFQIPARRYVAAGVPGSEAHDCDDGQVTVALSQVAGNLAAAQGDGVVMSGDPAVVPVSSATLLVQIAFPHPVPADDGAPPSTAALQAAGEASMGAAWVLKRARDRVMAEWDSIGVRAGPVAPSGPSGGLAAVNLTITFDIW